MHPFELLTPRYYPDMPDFAKLAVRYKALDRDTRLETLLD